METPIDVFLSHASEDKPFVRGLASALQDRGFAVWLDEHQLVIGQSLRAQIDRGLRRSRFGVVVISRSFFAKRWPQMELDGLLTLDQQYSRIFPIWLDVDHSFVSLQSPLLAGRIAVLTESANPDYARVVDAIERAVRNQVEMINEAPAPLTAIADIPATVDCAGFWFGRGAAARSTLPSAVVDAELLSRLARGAALYQAVPDELQRAALLDRANRLPHHATAEIGPAGASDVLSLWIYTDTLYLQDFAFAPHGPAVHLKGLFGRGGVAEYITPAGTLRGVDRYAHLDVPDPYLAGPLALVFAVALRDGVPAARTPIYLCSRRGIRFPDDVWADGENRPLWNRTDCPVPERRFAFQSMSDRFLTRDLFTVGFSGANLRQVTGGRTAAANLLADDEQGWVFEWIDESSFWYSSMRDGWHQRVRGTDHDILRGWHIPPDGESVTRSGG